MENERYAEREKKLFNDRRDTILVIAVLVASVTYTAGLSPPGGLWQDDLNGHKAGSSILRDKSPYQYANFFYANATAFIASLVLIMLIVHENYNDHWLRFKLIYIFLVLSLVSLSFAYAAGCERTLSHSSYVIALVVAFVLHMIFEHVYIIIPKNSRRFFPTAFYPQAEVVQEGE